MTTQFVVSSRPAHHFIDHPPTPREGHYTPTEDVVAAGGSRDYPVPLVAIERTDD